MSAPDKATEIKAAITLILATLTALWGWLGWAIIVWAVCIGLDYASGTAAAKKAGEWSSDVARDGLWHKLGEIFAVLVAALCDISLSVIMEAAGVPLPFEVGPVITPLVLLWYIITELGSITENAGRLGAPVPVWLKKSLKEYKNKIDADRGVELPEDNDNSTYTGRHEREAQEEPKGPPDAPDSGV